MSLFTDEQMEQFRKLLVHEFDVMFDKKIKQLTGHVEQSFQALRSENTKLKRRIAELETETMRNQVEIHGFPTEPKLTELEIVGRLAKVVGFELHVEQVFSARRVGPVKKTSDVTHQLIHVEFSRPDVCERFLDKVTQYRKSLTGSNELTAKAISTKAKPAPLFVARRISFETKRLRWLAMQKKTAANYKYCWISKNGRLCMKKSDGSEVVPINSEEDILRIK